MTAIEKLDAYAVRRYEVEHGGPDCYHLDSRELSEIAPAAFAALRAVLDLHKSVSWVTECLDHSQADDHHVDHFFVGTDGDVWACEESREPNVCQECSPDDADDDERPSVAYPCATVRAISSALEGS